EIDPCPAPLLRDRQLQETFIAQPTVIFDRMRCVAVMLGGAGGEFGRQFPAAPLQAPVLLAQSKIHPPALLARPAYSALPLLGQVGWERRSIDCRLWIGRHQLLID